MNHTAISNTNLEVIGISAFQDNYIWLLRQGENAIVVDPGDEHPVLQKLAELQLKLIAVLVTHHHADHQGGAAILKMKYSVPIYGPATESIMERDIALMGGEELSIPGFEGKFGVISVPGHTQGHIAYTLPGLLFCGDTLFGAGCGRLFEGTAQQMFDSIRRLCALSDDTLIYCAHEYTAHNLSFAQAVEPDNSDIQARIEQVKKIRIAGEPSVPATLILEKATNPFLRCHQPGVIAAAQQRQPDINAKDPVQVFSVIRKWRNQW